MFLIYHKIPAKKSRLRRTSLSAGPCPICGIKLQKHGYFAAKNRRPTSDKVASDCVCRSVNFDSDRPRQIDSVQKSPTIHIDDGQNPIDVHGALRWKRTRKNLFLRRGSLVS